SAIPQAVWGTTQVSEGLSSDKTVRRLVEEACPLVFGLLALYRTPAHCTGKSFTVQGFEVDEAVDVEFSYDDFEIVSSSDFLFEGRFAKGGCCS
ncbi:hypothetical protein L195_g021480, partial [Trifolium pratense]